MAEKEGKRVKAVKEAAKAAGVKINKDLKEAGKRINKAELDAINKKITKAGGTAVSFETTAKGAPAATGTTKTVASTINNGDGTFTIVYTDGTTETSGTSRTETTSKQQRTNWKEFFKTTLTEWGVPQLADEAIKFVDRGFTADTVILKLQDTDAFKKRFAANETRKTKGLAIIDPATYLALESTYQSAMRAAGLPKGFYDELSDFTTLIAADVSPAELNQRINIAADFIDTADPAYKNQLKRFYGMGESDMIAFALDPERSLPLLERKANVIKFASEGNRQDIQVGLGSAERYADMGVSQEEARVGFEQIAEIAPEAEKLSAVFAGQEESVSQEDVMSAVFTGENSAKQKRKLQRLSQSNVDLFSGGSGVGRGSLGKSQTGQI
ncbi:MAG: hypothetical protein WAO29_01395 [Candidatus Nanopelagicales bacterium]